LQVAGEERPNAWKLAQLSAENVCRGMVLSRERDRQNTDGCPYRLAQIEFDPASVPAGMVHGGVDADRSVGRDWFGCRRTLLGRTAELEALAVEMSRPLQSRGHGGYGRAAISGASIIRRWAQAGVDLADRARARLSELAEEQDGRTSATVCHCRDCQKFTGSSPVSATAPPDASLVRSIASWRRAHLDDLLEPRHQEARTSSWKRRMSSAVAVAGDRLAHIIGARLLRRLSLNGCLNAACRVQHLLEGPAAGMRYGRTLVRHLPQ
jgi:hypothetical protein